LTEVIEAGVAIIKAMVCPRKAGAVIVAGARGVEEGHGGPAHAGGEE